MKSFRDLFNSLRGPVIETNGSTTWHRIVAFLEMSSPLGHHSG